MYSSPFIWLGVATEQDKNGRWQLKERFAKFDVSEIGYDQNRKINKLRIINAQTGETVYEYGERTAKKRETPKQDVSKQKQTVTPPVESKATEQQVAVTATSTVPTGDVPEYLQVYRAFLQRHSIDKKQFAELRLKAIQDKKAGVTDKNFRELTSDEWIELIGVMEDLYATGYYKDVA